MLATRALAPLKHRGLAFSRPPHISRQSRSQVRHRQLQYSVETRLTHQQVQCRAYAIPTSEKVAKFKGQRGSDVREQKMNNIAVELC